MTRTRRVLGASRLLPGMVYRSMGDTLRIEETVTDGDGRFRCPAWGPVTRPARLHLEHNDPRILLFRRGIARAMPACAYGVPPVDLTPVSEAAGAA